MKLTELVRLGGRKYAVVLYTLERGFLLSLLGLLIIALEPAVASHVGTILGAFGLLGSASIVAYNGANAAADWYTTPPPKAAPTGEPSSPRPPRQSGMIPEPRATRIMTADTDL